MDLKVACHNILDQVGEIIEQIPEVDYGRPQPMLGGSTLGQHFRHALEFYQCLMAGADTGTISYDHRNHDKNLEVDKYLALELITKIQGFITNADLNETLNLAVSYSPDTLDSVTVPSNMAREIVYNIEHVVHHMALVKIGLRESCKGVIIPADFGVAVSTLKYQRSMV